jgi:uncharacterized iron-regulated membrane protein
MIAAIEGQPVAQAELIHEADLYHYGRRNPAVLPAVRIRLADPEETTWYLDPASGRVLGRVDAANRLHRWVFNGLHRLDFPPSARCRPCARASSPCCACSAQRLPPAAA